MSNKCIPKENVVRTKTFPFPTGDGFKTVAYVFEHIEDSVDNWVIRVAQTNCHDLRFSKKRKGEKQKQKQDHVVSTTNKLGGECNSKKITFTTLLGKELPKYKELLKMYYGKYDSVEEFYLLKQKYFNLGKYSEKIQTPLTEEERKNINFRRINLFEKKLKTVIGKLA